MSGKAQPGLCRNRNNHHGSSGNDEMAPDLMKNETW